VFYVLEDGFACLLVNAAHIKQVPGRKTDVLDCIWIAQLLEHGLLRGSFVPPAPIRQLRDLTRHRKVLIQERKRAANRPHKLLQDAGIKLASVATDILGMSGRAMLEALVQGTVDTRLAPFAEALPHLDTVPGIARRTAEVIVVEIGVARESRGRSRPRDVAQRLPSPGRGHHVPRPRPRLLPPPPRAPRHPSRH
jgi:transposase